MDDVLATGGTAAACVDLVKLVKADPVSLLVVLELEALRGQERLKGLPVHALIVDEGD